MNKIRKGDTVIVTTGKDKGRTGSVLRVLKKKNNPNSGLWVVVESVNIIKKHIRGNPQLQKPGGIISKEAAIHSSNVALLDPITKKAAKIGIKALEDGRKVRYLKTSGEVYDA